MICLQGHQELPSEIEIVTFQISIVNITAKNWSSLVGSSISHKVKANFYGFASLHLFLVIIIRLMQTSKNSDAVDPDLQHENNCILKFWFFPAMIFFFSRIRIISNPTPFSLNTKYTSLKNKISLIILHIPSTSVTLVVFEALFSCEKVDSGLNTLSFTKNMSEIECSGLESVQLKTRVFPESAWGLKNKQTESISTCRWAIIFFHKIPSERNQLSDFITITKFTH